MKNEIAVQRFMEHVRSGWKSTPEVLHSLQNGETTAKDQATAYFEVDETEGLTIDEATAAIDRALQSPAY